MVRAKIRGRWRPAVEVEQAAGRFRFAPRASDRYVVVDDIEAGRAVVVSSPWPDVDDLGHLVFPEDAAAPDDDTAAAGSDSSVATSQDFPLSELQAAVDQQRSAASQPAPDRPLRVGDVFWVRRPARGEGTPGRWRMLDVTRAARRAARAASLVAANPSLRVEAPAPAPASAPEQARAPETAAAPEETSDEPGRTAPSVPPTGAAQAAV